MTDQNQTSSANQPSHKRQPKGKEAAVSAEQAGQQPGLAQLPAEPVGSEVADGRAIPEALLHGDSSLRSE